MTSMTWIYDVHYESMSMSNDWNGGRGNPAYRPVRHFLKVFVSLLTNLGLLGALASSVPRTIHTRKKMGQSVVRRAESV